VIVARSVRWRELALVVLLAAAAVMAGCKRSSAQVAAVPDQPSTVVKADSEGLLLTWIDDKGDFHVETRVADVPMMGKDTVRVVDPNVDETAKGDAGDRVVVTDLRQASPAGIFPVRFMARADFESLAVARREKTGPTLAGGGQPPPTPGAPSANGAEPPAAGPGIRGQVVIYGAEWCSACHEAARYLRRKGVAYVEKDIEKDADAAREMQAKLARNGLRAGSIPVIDVRGKVMVGFNAGEIDAALGAAL
jgi:glutaredoxin